MASGCLMSLSGYFAPTASRCLRSLRCLCSFGHTCLLEERAPRHCCINPWPATLAAALYPLAAALNTLAAKFQQRLWPAKLSANTVHVPLISGVVAFAAHGHSAIVPLEPHCRLAFELYPGLRQQLHHPSGTDKHAPPAPDISNAGGLRLSTGPCINVTPTHGAEDHSPDEEGACHLCQSELLSRCLVRGQANMWSASHSL